MMGIEIFIQLDLVHATRHRKALKRVAIGLSLVRPYTSSSLTMSLATIVPILAASEAMPHARLNTAGELTRPKKQVACLFK
ncbi:hypothetical protein [Sphingomonas sp. GM_Shp_2]|uniref:hypothetical protein n=1 Tax=Sphingomonas sp. GM_Shp_2 TaxID=2937380 RepID=UPI00226A3C90|nr:hypothetical protein [Sphingomonas sp. GM_Shp_2]